LEVPVHVAIQDVCSRALALGVATITGDLSLQAAGDKAVTVTDKDNDTKVKLPKGQTLLVKLPMQAGTGFLWEVAKVNKDHLKQQGKYETEKPDKKVVGGKVSQVYRFKAEAAGTSDLELHYKRPFEKDKPPAKTFKITVVVE
jgi:inhibitor of cysteine peptidase